MTTTIFTMMMCFLAGTGPNAPAQDYCKRLDISTNQYETLAECEAALRPMHSTKEIEFFCAKKDVPMWTRAR